ncbi:ABC transporter ATP-binding protein [Sinanaerobacter sp. ZZT-01]|uniref:ABC transporter ATP-binding protein n=1 Tax=Sinanaerobacter sp. ZZT-01 TaxID=3111540 RepID=UPI002D76687D|nr:ABC transporter ATP-binding protein [Sinanaerobacter sp. ZZT-01]WRR93434.1 ABC transporter ATP-binding protein [Sinanaerobacter sp. ZZT-01]
MLSIENISIEYQKRDAVVQAFNLEVKKGQIVSLVGESGSGKTSVIRAAMGLLPSGGKVTKGDIRFDGDSVMNYSRKEWDQFRGSRISMIFQDSGAMINPIRKIGHQFIEYIRSHDTMSKKDAWDMGREMLERMQLPNGEHIMHSYPFELSGGMRQRVGIAMAMTFQPQLLLADEPTSALDVTTQAQIVSQMMDLRAEFGTGLVIVTHNLGVAAYMSDKIIVMRDGEIVDEGDRESILKNPASEYTKRLIASVPTLEGKRYVE